MKSDAVKIKNRRKKVRVLVQILILVVLGGFLYIKLYHGEYTTKEVVRTEDKFIALSYIGVQKYESDSTTRISQERLEEHMKALEGMGYTTITQEEVTNLYKKQELVPEKSLFLMFEDGRRDTGVLTHELLKDHNYIATMMTYAEKFEQKDNRFLSARDMQILMDTSYWEYGSNGYRLEYINVFDRYKNFFGHIDSNVYNSVTSYIERDYNHYLMDYIRDEDRLPTETYEEMVERITGDYKSMRYIYTEQMDEAPGFYALMHANTGQFATVSDVSKVNESSIRSMYDINFNREGFSQNTVESSAYDLTRMQPQSNWYSNHLIMRIVDDTKEEPVFVIGDEKESHNWTLDMGAAEYRDNAIVVTSEPNSSGKINQKLDLNESTIDVNLDGNKAGVQKIVLLEDNEENNGVEIVLDYNTIYINNIFGAEKGNVFEIDLSKFDQIKAVSVEEDEVEGLTAYSNAIIQYEKKYNMLQNANVLKEELKKVQVNTVSDGADEYVATIGINERASREISIKVEGQNISLYIDGMVAIKNLNLNREMDYQILSLEAGAVSEIQEQYSQRNIYDDVYDAVFTDLIVTNNETEEVQYSYTLTPWDQIIATLNTAMKNMATIVMEIF